MEQTYEDLTQKLKFENENSEMDIEGTVIKVELKPPLTQIQKLSNERQENANQDKHFVESTENQANNQNEESQNALWIEETIDLKLGNEEIRSFICGKGLHFEGNSFAMKETFTKKAKVKIQNICDICKKSFTTKSYLKLHVKTVHNEVKEHKSDIYDMTFQQNSGLRSHIKTIHNLTKPCNERFGSMSTLENQVKTSHDKIKYLKCNSCDKNFKQEQGLKNHFRVVHENIKAYNCDSCNKSFGYKKDLGIHVKTIQSKNQVL